MPGPPPGCADGGSRHGLLDEAEVDDFLAAHSYWRLFGSRLRLELGVREFDDAMRFAQRVSDGAVDHGRRPDICVVDYNTVRLWVRNPRRAGITVAELRLVEKVSAVVGECDAATIGCG